MTGLAILLAAGAARAQEGLPTFQDPQHRVEKPDTSGLRVIRFITEDDYPPFNFNAPDGSLVGFNVDLARALCDELKVACTVQPRRWDTIIDTIAGGQADAAMASLAINAQNRARVDFTAPYYRTPARFVARKQAAGADVRPETTAAKKIGVVAKTAHEAYLRAYFPQAAISTYASIVALRSALRRNEIDLMFGDGVTLAVWLNSNDAADCCAFSGGPFTESRYFGDGVGIAVRKDNATLRRALDYALKRLSERGVYADIYLKYFPVSFY